ncbi:zinc finger BED domain-containing protein RICESLEEPER 2, partial [Tanacetum coccineum]
VLRGFLLHRSSINNSASLSNKFGKSYFIFRFRISGLLHQVITAIADRIRGWKGISISCSSLRGRDLLSVQASTVASKSAFSIGGRVLSIRKTRLTPTSLEMCICLKDHLDAAERIQHISSLEDGLDYEEQLHDVEVETGLTISLSDEEIALDEAASEARSFEAKEEDLTLEEALN